MRVNNDRQTRGAQTCNASGSDRRWRGWLVSLAFPLLSVNTLAGQGSPVIPEGERAAVASVFADYADPTKPGVSILVAKDGVVRHRFHRGAADVGAQTPIADQTVFNVGSVAKQFTVFGVLLLQDDGKLRMTDDIRTYVPELPDYGHVITLEHLARHTSGLRSQQYAGLLGSWTQTDLRSHAQMLDLIRRQPALEFVPGSQFRYSNAGTVLLAEVIARVSGMPFHQFLKTRIYEPLDMDETFNRQEAASIIPQEAHSYYIEDGLLKKAINPSGIQGYSNVYSTTTDLLKWRENFRTPKVGSAAAVAALTSITELPGTLSTPHRMGLYSTPYRGYTQYQHTGSDRGYTSYFGWFPEIDLTIVILCNIEGIDVFAAAYALADIYLPPDVSNEMSIDARSELPSQAAPLNRSDLERYQGSYWSDAVGAIRRIVIDEDEVFYVRSDSNRSLLVPTARGRFKMAEVPEDVFVSFDGERMTFEDSTGTIVFDRYDTGEPNRDELDGAEGLYVSDEISSVYRISLCNGQLIATNAVRDLLEFSRVRKDLYVSNGWFFRSLRFRRDNQDRVIGFDAANVGVTNVRFTKVLSPHLAPPRYNVCEQVKPLARG